MHFVEICIYFLCLRVFFPPDNLRFFDSVSGPDPSWCLNNQITWPNDTIFTNISKGMCLLDASYVTARSIDIFENSVQGDSVQGDSVQGEFTAEEMDGNKFMSIITSILNLNI